MRETSNFLLKRVCNKKNKMHVIIKGLLRENKSTVMGVFLAINNLYIIFSLSGNRFNNMMHWCGRFPVRNIVSRLLNRCMNSVAIVAHTNVRSVLISFGIGGTVV